MSLRNVQPLFLRDGQERDLGQVVIGRVERDLVLGLLTPGPAYPQVERRFAEYVRAANDQLLSTVAELDERSGALGLRRHSLNEAAVPAIYDVQIGDGVITFRTRPAADESRLPDVASLTSLADAATRPGTPTS
jgi:hypothetical protein